MRFFHAGPWHNRVFPGKRLPIQMFIFAAMVLCSTQAAFGGNWSLQVSSPSYTHTFDGNNFGPIVHFPASPVNNSIGLGPISVGGSGTIGTPAVASVTLSATVTGTWVPASPGDNPPASQSVKIVASALGYSPNSSTSTATASDGFGDAPVDLPYDGYYAVSSSGTHLQQINGTTFTVSISMSASCTDNGSATRPGFATAEITGISLSIDTRSATVRCGLGSTSYKGPAGVGGLPTIVQNEPQSDGTLTYTTVGPDTLGDNPSLLFSGFANGSFGTLSLYNMYSAAKSYDQSGTFNGTGIVTSFTNVYTDPTVSSEHVNLHLTDSVDGAVASGNCYVDFHNAVEDWATTSGPTPGPSPAPTLGNPGAWTYFTSLSNVTGTTPLTQTITETASDESDVDGTISTTDGFTLTAAQLSAAFTQNESATIGNKYTASMSVAVTFTVPAGKTLYLYWANSVTQSTGTCDGYSSQGYCGQQTWTLNQPALGPGGVAGISWYPLYQ